MTCVFMDGTIIHSSFIRRVDPTNGLSGFCPTGPTDYQLSYRPRVTEQTIDGEFGCDGRGVPVSTTRRNAYAGVSVPVGPWSRAACWPFCASRRSNSASFRTITPSESRPHGQTERLPGYRSNMIIRRHAKPARDPILKNSAFCLMTDPTFLITVSWNLVILYSNYKTLEASRRNSSGFVPGSSLSRPLRAAPAVPGSRIKSGTTIGGPDDNWRAGTTIGGPGRQCGPVVAAMRLNSKPLALVFQ